MNRARTQRVTALAAVIALGAPMAAAATALPAGPERQQTQHAQQTHQAPRTLRWATAPAKAPKARAEVPWDEVGAGWLLFTADAAGATTLYLASPQGQAYAITTLEEGWQVWDARRDGRAAVVGRDATSRVVDLVTGEARAAIPNRAPADVDFSRAVDAELVAWSALDFRSTTLLNRLDLDGTVLRAKESALAYVVQAEDGTRLVGALADSPVPVDRETLDIGAPYGLPAGYTACVPVGTWDASSVLEQCLPDEGPSGLFSQPVAGGAPTARATGLSPQGTPWRHAWSTPLGVVAVPHSDSEGGAGPAAPSLLARGRVAPIPLPPGYASRMGLEDVSGSRLYLRSASHPGEPADLAIVEPLKRRVVPVAGGGAGVPGSTSRQVVVVGSRLR